MSNQVATRESPAVPALAPTPATTITAEDIAIPKLYVGNQMSKAVKKRAANFGDIYLAESADADDPQVLWEFGSTEPGVLIHVLHVRKGLSYKEQGGDLQTWQFGDPNADGRAWTTYTYTLILPEVDPDMPATLLLTRSGKPTAQKINTVLARNAASGPMYANAFRLTTAERHKDDNDWAIFQAQTETAAKKHVGQAAALYEQIAPGLDRASRHSNGSDEPDI